MTAHLDRNERPVRPGSHVQVRGVVERVDKDGAFIRVSPGLVVYVALAAVEVTE